ncbi:hypothetical protein [Actinosynnema sp.]|uniref:hypothetical protein n=1 Tax=Actinosynnema sp. TaxID=1872144 RepID=UPI003F865E4E
MEMKGKGCLVNLAALVAGAFGGVALTAVTGVLLFMPSTDVISSKPTEGDKPGIYVQESTRFFGGPTHEVWLGCVERAHVIEVPTGWEPIPEVEYTGTGLDLVFPDGGRISVPEAKYAGDYC